MALDIKTGGTLSPAEQHRVLSLISGAGAEKTVGQYLRSPVAVSLIAGGGSDRKFYRLSGRSESAVVMVSSSADGDFENHLVLSRFLRHIGVAVPEIYHADRKKFFLIMEDVGDENLYIKYREGGPEEDLIHSYQKVLEALVLMQIEGQKRWAPRFALSDRTFDYTTLRWETAYFREYFVESYCGISLLPEEDPEAEFDYLARAVAAEPHYFMHRDFQSQNIMIRDGKPRIIDFQGARKGLLHYDLASVLKDAYVVLPDLTRNRLLAFYLENLAERGVRIPSREQFEAMFTLAGLQRNMQALGAFAFLSLVKKKSWFRQYIPAGVHYLASALQDRKDLPRLRSLVDRIVGSLDPLLRTYP